MSNAPKLADSFAETVVPGDDDEIAYAEGMCAKHVRLQGQKIAVAAADVEQHLHPGFTLHEDGRGQILHSHRSSRSIGGVDHVDSCCLQQARSFDAWGRIEAERRIDLDADHELPGGHLRGELTALLRRNAL